jgi:hypothetical protein
MNEKLKDESFAWAITKFSSAIAGISLVGSIIGWLDTLGYYGYFGATWLVPQVPYISVVSNGLPIWFSLSIALFLAVGWFSEPKNEFSPKALRTIAVFVIILLVGFFVILNLKESRGKYFQGIFIFLTGVSIIYFSHLRSQKKIGIVSVIIAAFSILFVCGIAPLIFGNIRASADWHNSRLPIVHIKSIEEHAGEGSALLLLQAQDRFYVILPKQQAGRFKVSIFNSNDVSSIEGMSIRE